MLSKSQVSFVHSLYIDKFRKELGLFIAEGEKTISELLESSFCIEQMYATELFLRKHMQAVTRNNIPFSEISPEELNRLSLLKTPNQAIAVVKMPKPDVRPAQPEKELLLMLDRIQDPGNLGTMMRTADWFGIGQIICSTDCVDQYNPKVIQASMGSFLRVRVHYDDLAWFLSGPGSACKVFGTFTEGSNMYEETLPDSAVILIGNESAGISANLQKFIHKKISIPFYNRNKPGSRPESLNAAISAALVCAEFRRQNS